MISEMSDGSIRESSDEVELTDIEGGDLARQAADDLRALDKSADLHSSPSIIGTYDNI